MARIIVAPPRAADAVVHVPGDKSISHRAFLCASIARGMTTIVNANRGADVEATRNALVALGVPIDADATGVHRVRGVDAFCDPQNAIDCGNSGSTMRMLCGLLAGRANAVLDGDVSLRRRPMERVAAPLRSMGADVTTAISGGPPLRLTRKSERLHGARIEMQVASAQVKSAILLAALRADGATTIVEPLPTRDHTERMLRAMGAELLTDGRSISVRPSALEAVDVLRVPGDFSAAFFFIAGAGVLPGSHLTIRDVGINPTRVAALRIVREMGVDVALCNDRESSGEPVADIEVRGGSALLHGVRVTRVDVPNLIDEIPALCALAASASGEFTVRNAAELRAKESDRITTTAALLRAFNADVEEFQDGLTVRGGRPLTAPERVTTGGDHRIGMAAAILALAANAPIAIDDSDCIATSFPDFERAWNSAFAQS